jgi:hypothetical protein
MHRIKKLKNSEILEQDLKYIEGNSNNNSKISDILFNEQKGFCAYTEQFIGRADAKDIEHFNPTLKGKAEDSYNNWSLVKHQWNKEKSSKWEKFQPILDPSCMDFEERVIYDQGDYRISTEEDIEASNLIKLLKLDDLLLADERKKYITRKREEIEKFGQSPNEFFEILIEADLLNQISYLRALKEEFNVDILENLSK